MFNVRPHGCRLADCSLRAVVLGRNTQLQVWRLITVWPEFLRIENVGAEITKVGDVSFVCLAQRANAISMTLRSSTALKPLLQAQLSWG